MQKKIRRKLLILACGRSATTYTAACFQKIGLDIGHEIVGKDGTVSMYFMVDHADVSLVNKNQALPIHPNQYRDQYKFDHIWHQVRDPLKSIDSMAKAFSLKVRLWANDQLGVTLPGLSGKIRCPLEDKLHWAMHYWRDCNRMCAKQASKTYRVEDMELFWDYMLDELKIDRVPLPNVSTTKNQNLRFAFKGGEKTKKLRAEMHNTSWKTLRGINRSLATDIENLAEAYGY